MSHRIDFIEPDPDNLRLTLHWRNGAVTVKDLRKNIARRALFAPLSDPSVFRRVRILDDGYAIAWPGTAIDLAADALWYQAHPREMPYSDEVMTPGEFKRWMRGQGLSLSGVAEVLDLSRRSVAYYASGERKVPRVVFLACMALASARRKTSAAA
jgi:Protein of unknown function (DUF2442)